jgi:hypothetical protein
MSSPPSNYTTELQHLRQKLDNLLMPYVFFKQTIKILPKSLIEVEIGKHFKIEYLKKALFHTFTPTFQSIKKILQVHLQNKISSDFNGLVEIPFDKIHISRDIMNNFNLFCKSIDYPITQLYTKYYDVIIKKINYFQNKITFLKTALDIDNARALMKKQYKLQFYSRKSRRIHFEVVKICNKIVKMKSLNNSYYTDKFQLKMIDFINNYLQNDNFHIYIYGEHIDDYYVKVNKLNINKYI